MSDLKDFNWTGFWNDVDYEFEDYTLAPGARIKFRFEGTISMQRNINTQIPDKDQAIEWD